MGIALGTPISLSGDTIYVKFLTDAWEKRTLDVVSVTISMTGGVEYTPVKYATASITLCCDGTELLPLCSNVTEIEITNKTTGVLLFSGYTTQNTFTQPLMSDTITIECVDRLGYAKFTPVPDLAFIANSSIAGWVKGFAEALGIKGAYMSKKAILRRQSDKRETAKYYMMSFPGRYFLKDAMPDIINGKANYARQRMTVYEALEMIASSLRMTFHIFLGDLYLSEPLDNGDKAEYVNVSGTGGVTIEHLPLNLDAEDFGGTDNSVTTLPIYTYFSIMHDKLEERTVCLPVFDDKYLKPLNQKHTYSKGDEAIVVYKMQSLVSAVDSDDYSGAEWISWKKLKKDDESSDAQRGTECAYDSTFTKAVRIWTINGLKKNLLVVPIVPGISVSPGWGRGLKIKAKITITDDINLPFPDVEIDDAFPLIWVRLRVGNSYYDGKAWTSEEVVFGMRVRKDGTTYIAEYVSDHRDYIPYEGLQADGLADVEIGIALNDYGKVGEYRVGYLTELDVVEVLMPDVANTESLWHSPAREETGEYDASREYGEVTLPVDLYYMMSEKSFSTCIDGIDYSEGTSVVGAELLFGPDKLTMLQKVQATASPSDRLQFDLSVNDLGVLGTYLTQPVICSRLFDGNKRVAGYEKDILNNSAKITVI